MHAEQFDVRRIRDGVTYSTKASQLLAYADGYGEDGGRWRAGLFRTPAGGFFAVREEAGRHFDQISGRWLDNTSVSLDVLDRRASLAWCEHHDANVLVDFAEGLTQDPNGEVSGEPEGVASSGTAEGLLLPVSGAQREALEEAARKANLAIGDYVLLRLETTAAAENGAVEEPTDAAAADEAAVGASEAADDAAAEDETPAPDEVAAPAGDDVERPASVPEAQPVAGGHAEAPALADAEPSEAPLAGSDSADPEAVQLLKHDVDQEQSADHEPDVDHEPGVGLNGQGAEQADIRQAAE